MKAEYVARSIASQEAIWLRSFLQNLNLTSKVDDLVTLLGDDTTGVQFALCETR